ncbi:hypothetical protein DKM44_04165 [Deinococcus irradiatisoli]|uniref:Imelysin-like domain-containing protein n=1 Tax=Deinococcus irradiatisoli TaxID=2202254 RepID=A0A2Z3JGQ7_9DEIO|nr:hypothetical protein [Deinococcus irradiatisoli]AWN22530.1 hypothetical protein DKM44_04165 [Deinococcus irradiatisoli]
MTPRFFPLALLLGLGLPGAAHAAPLPCALVSRLDLDTYLSLSLDHTSEADLDQGSLAYAACLSGQLSGELAGSPNLAARIGKLRELYRQLRSLEGGLAYAMAGGGTMHSHAVPRSYPDIERTLGSLAALASSPLGGQTGPRFQASLTASRQAFDARIKALKAWKPKDAAASTFYDPKQFQADVSRYAQTGAAILQLLGNRADAATAAGALPLSSALFLDDYLSEF